MHPYRTTISVMEGDIPAWAQRYIDELAPSDLITMLSRPLDLSILQVELRSVRQEVGFKPRGLWFACGGEWIRFAYSNGMKSFVGDRDHVYRLTLDRSRIAHLLTEGDMLRFNRMYYAIKDDSGDSYIDWQRVSRDYDGIIICPYHYKLRQKLFWYYPWDVASGCIWRFRALQNVEDISPSRSER